MNDETIVRTQQPVTAPKPLRVMITAAATSAYYDLTDEALKQQLLDRLVTVCGQWRRRPGVRFITSFDDDLLLVGDPRGFQRWSIYIILEVETMETVVAMIDDCRQGELKLHTYFTVGATLGRPFWPIEPAAESSTA